MKDEFGLLCSTMLSHHHYYYRNNWIFVGIFFSFYPLDRLRLFLEIKGQNSTFYYGIRPLTFNSLIYKLKKKQNNRFGSRPNVIFFQCVSFNFFFFCPIDELGICLGCEQVHCGKYPLRLSHPVCLSLHNKHHFSANIRAKKCSNKSTLNKSSRFDKTLSPAEAVWTDDNMEAGEGKRGLCQANSASGG